MRKSLINDTWFCVCDFDYDNRILTRETTAGVIVSGGAGEAWRLLSVQDYEQTYTSEAGTTIPKYALPGYDGRGNIVTWTNGVTGELIGTADYGPYGERFDMWWATEADEASYERFGFGTECRDETGLIYYGARYYSPALGRFISRDPAGVAGSGVNLYAFCGGDPVNNRELYGLCSGGGAWGAVKSFFSWVGNQISGAYNWLCGLFSGSTADQAAQPDGAQNSSAGTGSGGEGGGGGAEGGGSGKTDNRPYKGPYKHVPTYWEYQYSQMSAYDQVMLRNAGIVFYDSSDYEDYLNLIKPIVEYNSMVSPYGPRTLDGNSSVGNFFRDNVPLVGGMIGGILDIASGIVNTSFGLLSGDRIGGIRKGMSEILGGAGGLAVIGIVDAIGAFYGVCGKVYVTVSDVANVLTLGEFVFPDRSGVGKNGENTEPTKTEFWGALKQLIRDAPIPCYGFYLGPNWGTTQLGYFHRGDLVINQADYYSGYHDNTLRDREWDRNQLRPTPDGVLPNGPIADAIVLVGLLPFWINNGP